MKQLPDEFFRARAEELGRWFVAADGALPRVGSDDPHEQRLGAWRQKQLRGLRDKTLLATQERYLDTVAPGWRSRLTGIEVFHAKADELGRWLSHSGAAPSRHSDDPHERQLGRWRRRWLHALRDRTLPPEQERYLDEVAPGWRRRTRNVVGFHARAQALGQWFVSADGKMPNNRSDDRYERQLYEWRRVWRTQLRDGTLPQEQERYLDEVAPGWRPRAVSGADEFCAQAESLGAWLRSNVGQVPRRSGADEHERELAAWRKCRHVSLSAGTLPPEHEAYLDKVAPGWRPSQDRSDAFRAQAVELGRWLRSTGRLPQALSADLPERQLATWRRRQLGQLHAGTLPPERERYLDEVAPEWRSGGDGKYQARADELGGWMLSTGRLPSRNSTDAQEQRLYTWRRWQVQQLHAGTLTPEREEYLDTVAPRWRPPDAFETFQVRADELGQWFRSAGRPPSGRSTDARERRLCAWRRWQVERLHAGTLTPECEEYLDTVAAGWRPAQARDETFRSQAEALGRWMSSNDGAAPSGSSDDPDERRLSAWRYGQSQQARTGRLSAERERYLDDVAPGWRVPVRNVVGFHAQARAVGQWMVWADGKVPSQRSDDWYERRLCRWRQGWLAQLRTGTLSSERERYLDEVVPGWRPRARSGVDEFPDQAVALGRWLASTDGGLPSRGSDDLHERRLCRWRQGWLFHLRNGTLSAERERYLDQVAAGWRPRRRDGETPRAPGPPRARAEDPPGAVEPPSPTDAVQLGIEHVSTKDGT